MRIDPNTLARRIAQQLLQQGRMISIELQIAPGESRVTGELYGCEVHVVPHMIACREPMTSRDSS